MIDKAAVLARFDEQIRRAVVDDDGIVAGDSWSAVLWPATDVERTVARLRELPGHAEWKHYGHDPADLPERLRALGLEPEDEEAVMVAEAAAVPPVPADVELRVDADAFLQLVGTESARTYPLPPNALAVVACVDGAPVSGGRVDLDPGTDFAGFYGGVTLPAHRGRGLYRATVAKRAELARERGYRYVFVDALPTSRPILERVGFTQLTTTTPYVFSRDPVFNRDLGASSSG